MALLCVNLFVEIDLTLHILPRKKGMTAFLNRTHIIYICRRPTELLQTTK